MITFVACLDETKPSRLGQKGARLLNRAGIEGEVLVADNNLTDRWQNLAGAVGARVVQIENKGYGNALLGGMRASNGRYVIMTDADDTYSIQLSIYCARAT